MIPPLERWDNLQEAREAGGYERIPPRSGLVHELIKDHSQLERDIWERVHRLTQEVDAGYALLMTDEDGTLLVDEGMGFEARDPHPEKDGWTLWLVLHREQIFNELLLNETPRPVLRHLRGELELIKKTGEDPRGVAHLLHHVDAFAEAVYGWVEVADSLGVQAFGQKQNILQMKELHKYLPRWKGMEEILAGEILGFALAECVDQEIRENDDEEDDVFFALATFAEKLADRLSTVLERHGKHGAVAMRLLDELESEGIAAGSSDILGAGGSGSLPGLGTQSVTVWVEDATTLDAARGILERLQSEADDHTEYFKGDAAADDQPDPA